jgi:hypothetical protein
LDQKAPLKPHTGQASVKEKTAQMSGFFLRLVPLNA